MGGSGDDIAVVCNWQHAVLTYSEALLDRIVSYRIAIFCVILYRIVSCPLFLYHAITSVRSSASNLWDIGASSHTISFVWRISSAVVLCGVILHVEFASTGIGSVNRECADDTTQLTSKLPYPRSDANKVTNGTCSSAYLSPRIAPSLRLRPGSAATDNDNLKHMAN